MSRPSLYDPAHCAGVVEFLKDGYSIAAFAGSIGVCRATIHNWMTEQPEFLDAVKRGQAAAVLWWEQTHRKVAEKGEGNVTACIFGLKNRAADDWRDKTETEHSGAIQVARVERIMTKPGEA